MQTMWFQVVLLYARCQSNTYLDVAPPFGTHKEDCVQYSKGVLFILFTSIPVGIRHICCNTPIKKLNIDR